MSAIPNGVIFIWTGTNASIPSGWERVTALDGRYPKGTADGVDPNQTGGSPTHSHTSSSHTHTMEDHTHTISISAATGGTGDNGSTSGGAARKGHTHSSFSSGLPNNVSVSSTSVTYSSVSNDPPYYTVIFITPTSDTNVLPQDVVYLYEDADFSISGHYVCDGNNSTPDLTDKYLKGAVPGQDAGNTGGSTTNIHSIDHSHTVSHTHESATSGGATITGGSQAGTGRVSSSHTHSISLPNSTTDTGTTVIQLTTTETVEPAYTKLMAIQNKTSNGTRVGIIGLWLGALENIPSNYILLDGNNGTTDMRGRYLKVSSDYSGVGSSGGSNTHTHAAQGHTHNNISHTHTFTTSLTHGSQVQGLGSGIQIEGSAATHSGASISTDNYSLASSMTSADVASNEPEYRTVAFIKLVSLTTDASFLLNMLNN